MPKILIVEDNNSLRSVYANILLKEGFEVFAASGGQEALDHARVDKPDLILIDMLMPVVNGLEFLRQYDINGSHPDVKVIAFSNFSEPKIEEEARKLGALKYITKATTTPKDLVDAINDTLSWPSVSGPAANI